MQRAYTRPLTRMGGLHSSTEAQSVLDLAYYCIEFMPRALYQVVPLASSNQVPAVAVLYDAAQLAFFGCTSVGTTNACTQLVPTYRPSGQLFYSAPFCPQFSKSSHSVFRVNVGWPLPREQFTFTWTENFPHALSTGSGGRCNIISGTRLS
ncbi:hypothetical protein ERJ75_001401900 [Trypanosoma vivax]|nr:hypothetical protein TRVL_06830 [Trypanosoma vivax]KAH8607519.1 hypothetical protein ERJ75_001401900 [Trypanosoma vivax]